MTARTVTAYRRWGKRAGDVVVSAMVLILCAPVCAVVAVLVRMFIGRPILFRQDRPGKDGRLFRLVKFRTMTDRRDHAGQPLPDAERLNAFGAILRSTSLDELPELWNVLRGHMSLVGPRPLLERYLDRYTTEQARRHEVRPGVTGLAQIGGRNVLSWERRFELDVEYVDRRSLALDARILFRTVWQVIARKDISQPGHVTAAEFMGGSRP